MKTKGRAPWIAIAVIGLWVAGASLSAASDERNGVLIHVTHGKDQPHRVLMALNMAGMMSEDHDVLVYFDIQGIEVVLKDAEEITHAAFDPASRQLQALQKKGVTLMACPGCLKAAGKTPDDLAAGVQVAEKGKLFSFTKGRILTLDY